MAEVKVTVRNELQQIIDQLEKLRDKNKEVSDSFKSTGQSVGDALENQTKKTENFMGKMASIGRRVSDQLKGDFKSLLSINALSDAFKISNQFRGSIKESVDLSDTIRKLGRTFGLARGDFVRFQSEVTKGLGEIGLSSEVASRAMAGLSTSGTSVSGQGSLIGYSRTAGQLSSVTRQQGSEGEVAKLMAQVIQARGGDVNDMKQLAAVAEDVRRVFNATGTGAQDTLNNMKQIFTSMSKDFRDKITSRGLANLASAANVAGPQSTKFLQEFLAKSKIDRMALEAQGFKGVFNDQGLDVSKFSKASKGIMSRIGGDPRKAAQTLGLSEEAAEGFVRLAQSLEQVQKAQDLVNKSTGDLSTQYQESMGLGEAFRANINRIKRVFAEPLSTATQGLTDALSGAAQSDVASGLVVGGGGILAALLAGAGLRGIGGGLLGGMAGTAVKGAAVSAATGKEVQPVYVVNAAEIAAGGALGGAGGLMGKLGAAGKMLAPVAGVAAAGALGYGAGTLANKGIDAYTQGQTGEGFEGNVIERLFFKLDKLLGGEASTTFMKNQPTVKVELNKRDLKEAKQPTRGASY